jgi:hypothetical protein
VRKRFGVRNVTSTPEVFSVSVSRSKAGTRTMTLRPPIGLSSSVMSPPWLRAMSRAMDEAEPGAAGVLVAGLVEAHEGLEDVFALDAGMPGPSSSTMTVRDPRVWMA